ncbi:F0F1 ATP synthase subunit delta [Oceanomicrobium pacificus]|uniref:ATP synthase subunit delta n=1 Tax=Oceanomicrobium pacificus TaxID=2692916 RepID=A0A6B0TR78_9RHOB|nr:F0F1 ATP synthase subunit delta [Oceanomicrobium pacificus]MXU64248.1 F0F1 ATP synthase subunit delta [Oceanomicrobium pacificus]
MSDTASMTSGIAGRYAAALFSLAQEEGKLETVEADLNALAEALDASPELRDLIASPVVTRGEQTAVMSELAKKMGLSQETTNTIGLMGAKRRLFVLPQLISEMKALLADARGEVTAEVTAAKKLTAAQQKSLSAALKKAVGKDVTVNLTVDEKIIGGLVVKVGSKMIDSSIRSKLNNLQNAMKEVG